MGKSDLLSLQEWGRGFCQLLNTRAKQGGKEVPSQFLTSSILVVGDGDGGGAGLGERGTEREIHQSF